MVQADILILTVPVLQAIPAQWEDPHPGAVLLRAVHLQEEAALQAVLPAAHLEVTKGAEEAEVNL